MKALILNSGRGTRLGHLTKDKPKCLLEISENDTILSRQLKMLCKLKITEAIITTGPFENQIKNSCHKLGLPLNIVFVNNANYFETNYIYSVYCAEKLLNDDVLLMHGDLVFSQEALNKVFSSWVSSMAVNNNAQLSKKDFKAVVKEGRIVGIGIEFFKNSVAAQPLYKLLKKDWLIWLEEICTLCRAGQVNCYAEKAFNNVSEQCRIYPVNVDGNLCCEVDTTDDLNKVRKYLEKNFCIKL